jgi:hypothetical protein
MTAKQTTVLRQLEKLRLPELQKRYAEAVGEPTRCPNRVYLIRRITEALESRAQPRQPPPAAPPEQASSLAPASTAPTSARSGALGLESQERALVEQRGWLKRMSVEELQAKYVEVVGRPTGSSNVAYLVWKIREATKGRVPVGPRMPRERAREFGEMKTLPFRIGTRQLEVLDKAWRTQGAKNRMDFMRLALGHYLAHIGAAEAAALFTSST